MVLLWTTPSETSPVSQAYPRDFRDKVYENKEDLLREGETEIFFKRLFYKFNFSFCRYNSNVIRLSNNNLVDTHGLYQLALDLVECPENIAWLDLSFNDLEEVTDDILE